MSFCSRPFTASALLQVNRRHPELLQTGRYTWRRARMTGTLTARGKRSQPRFGGLTLSVRRPDGRWLTVMAHRPKPDSWSLAVGSTDEPRALRFVTTPAADPQPE